MKIHVLSLYVICLLSMPLAAQEWTTNIENAKSKAQVSNQKIVLVFQESDWCAPCIKLDK